VDQFRRSRPESSLDEDELDKPPVSSEPAADQQVSRSEEVDLLRRALDRLPRDKKELLILSRFQELKHEQIAAILACEVNTVKVRVYRAMKDLAGAFQQVMQERRI